MSDCGCLKPCCAAWHAAGEFYDCPKCVAEEAVEEEQFLLEFFGLAPIPEGVSFEGVMPEPIDDGPPDEWFGLDPNPEPNCFGPN